jgi:hypothetical protein
MKRYERVPTLNTADGIQYRTTVLYPDTPPTSDDFYVISTVGDRYDTLAEQFYGDYRLWWVIAAANNSEKASLTLEPGVQIRIPFNINTIVENFVRTNR